MWDASNAVAPPSMTIMWCPRAWVALARSRCARSTTGERTGEVPYGYSATPEGRLVPNEAEQSIIALVRELRAAGMSLRAVVSELARGGKVSRVGRPLQVTQIVRILAG